MDPQERRAAEDRLTLLELLRTAQDRRHEVIDAVWGASSRDDARERLRHLLGDEADPGIVLDMQIGRLTAEERRRLSHEIADLRLSMEGHSEHPLGPAARTKEST